MRTALLLATALVFGGVAHLAGERAGSVEAAAGDPDELIYLPEGEILRMASFGHRNFLADLVWLHAIQYYGEHRLTDRNYDQAERLFRVIYDLDPSFMGAVRFGALVLSQDAGNPDGALTLLQEAADHHPEAWQYPFDQGFINHTVKRDYGAAGECYRRAAARPGAPPLAARLAGVSFARLGDRESSRTVWESILADTDNAMMKRIAVRSLMNLDLDAMQDRMTEGFRRFREERGRVPTGWDELVVAGYLDELPADPFGGAFFLDEATSTVWATTNVDRAMASHRDAFSDVVQELHARDGRFPPSLEVLYEEGVTSFEPWKPFGLSLDYDSETGRIGWNPPWPAVEPPNQGETGA